MWHKLPTGWTGCDKHTERMILKAPEMKLLHLLLHAHNKPYGCPNLQEFVLILCLPNCLSACTIVLEKSSNIRNVSPYESHPHILSGIYQTLAPLDTFWGRKWPTLSPQLLHVQQTHQVGGCGPSLPLSLWVVFNGTGNDNTQERKC